MACTGTPHKHFNPLTGDWVLVSPHRDRGSLLDFSDAETESRADRMRRTGIRYDNLFKTSCPYAMGIHQKPTDRQEHPGSLLRSAAVKKIMVGYELPAQPNGTLLLK